MPRRSLCSMIQEGRLPNRKQQQITRQIDAATKTQPTMVEYLDWSHQHIGFDKEDHPPQVPNPGHAALVLEGQIGGFESSKIFINGGSGINLIYADTMRAMNLSLANLAPSDTPFFGIVPGKPNLPLGQTIIEVTFGSPDNF